MIPSGLWHPKNFLGHWILWGHSCHGQHIGLTGVLTTELMWKPIKTHHRTLRTEKQRHLKGVIYIVPYLYVCEEVTPRGHSNTSSSLSHTKVSISQHFAQYI